MAVVAHTDLRVKCTPYQEGVELEGTPETDGFPAESILLTAEGLRERGGSIFRVGASNAVELQLGSLQGGIFTATDLTNATITMTIYDQAQAVVQTRDETTETVAAGGVYQITQDGTPTNGKFVLRWAAADDDLPTAGRYKFMIKIVKTQTLYLYGWIEFEPAEPS